MNIHQDAMLNTATKTVQQVREGLTGALGVAEPQLQELALKSAQNLEAVTQASTVLAQGVQEISREWFDFAEELLRRNIDGWNALTRCGSLQDLVSIQSSLVRDNLQQLVENNRRLTEVSVRVAQDASRTIQTQGVNSNTQPHRAA